MTDNQKPLLDDKKDEKEAVKEEQFPIAALAGFVMSVLDGNDIMFNTFLPEYYKGVRQLGLDAYGQTFCYLALGTLVSAGLVVLAMGPLGGPAKTFYYGLCSFAVTRVLLCFTVLIPISAPETFYWCMCALFAATGVAYSFGEIGIAAWVLSTCPEDERTKAYAVMTEGRIAGAIFGPMLGGMMYSGCENFTNAKNAFLGPIAFGLLLLILVLAYSKKTVFDAPYDREKVGNSLGFKSGIIFKSPPVAMLFIITVFGMGPMFFFAPIYQPLMFKDYQLSQWKFGVFNTVASFAFMIGAAVTPGLEKKLGTLGLLSSAFGFYGVTSFLIGPSPLLTPPLPDPSYATAWIPFLGVCCQMITGAPFFICTPPLMMKYAVRAGFSENDSSAQTGMTQIVCAALTIAVFPVAGGATATKLGLRWSITVGATVLSAICITLVGVLKLIAPAVPSGDDKVAVEDGA